MWLTELSGNKNIPTMKTTPVYPLSYCSVCRCCGSSRRKSSVVIQTRDRWREPAVGALLVWALTVEIDDNYLTTSTLTTAEVDASPGLGHLEKELPVTQITVRPQPVMGPVNGTRPTKIIVSA